MSRCSRSNHDFATLNELVADLLSDLWPCSDFHLPPSSCLAEPPVPRSYGALCRYQRFLIVSEVTCKHAVLSASIHGPFSLCFRSLLLHFDPIALDCLLCGWRNRSRIGLPLTEMSSHSNLRPELLLVRSINLVELYEEASIAR